MSSPVLFEEIPAADGYRIGRATLNAEKSINSLTLEMIDLLDAKLVEWQADPKIACIFLDGAGEKGFCAGGDVRKLYESAKECGAEKPNDYARDFFGREYRLDHRIHTFPKPIVVWGHGVVMGGGVGLMSGASHRVVTEATRFAMPEITIGLFPDVGGSFFLNRMPGRSGLFLGLTGAHCNAADVLFLGLADRYIPNGQRQAVLDALSAARWSDSEELNSATVGKVLRTAERVAEGERPLSNVRTHLDLIQQLTDADSCDAVVRKILACDSADPWIQRAQKTLRGGCPVTALLVWEQIRRAKHLSLADIFRMELVVAVQCLRHPDFAEGVRALLVDKDGAPRWLHPDVASVPQNYLEEFFTTPFAQHPLADL
ncbi:MAG: enoyl-CoA hydratase/isomerase family protein [Gammaproteobacteria bacterium]